MKGGSTSTKNTGRTQEAGTNAGLKFRDAFQFPQSKGRPQSNSKQMIFFAGSHARPAPFFISTNSITTPPFHTIKQPPFFPLILTLTLTLIHTSNSLIFSPSQIAHFSHSSQGSPLVKILKNFNFHNFLFSHLTTISTLGVYGVSPSQSVSSLSPSQFSPSLSPNLTPQTISTKLIPNKFHSP